ncbi:MAG: HEAT repeat domain-containing protein [Elusimicrobiota bacterium]
MILLSTSTCLFASYSDLSPEEATVKIDEVVASKKATKEFLNYLNQSLKNPETPIKIKESAAWALGELNAKQFSPTLLSAAQDKGLLVRSAAMDSLIKLRDSNALTLIMKSAKTDPILALRLKATLGLGLLKSDKGIQTIVDLSSDEREEIRAASVLSMGALHSKKNDFSEILKEMTQDKSEFVQERAKQTLALIKKTKQAAQNQLTSSDEDIRLFAALYLKSNGASKDISYMKEALNGESNDSVRRELEQAIQAIKKRNKPSKPAPKKKK